MIENIMTAKKLPVGSSGQHTSGWLGMLALIATEAALFAYLLFSYFYLATQAQTTWLPTASPSLKLALPNTFILITSSFILYWGERSIRKGKRSQLLLAIGLTLALGIVFMAIQVQEWYSKPFSMTDSAYGSMYFTITGFHMLHVLGGVIILAVVFLWTALGNFNAERHAPIAISAIYWHFVDIVWLVVFSTFYLYPYLR